MFILTVTLSDQLTTHVATKQKKGTNFHYRNRKQKGPFPTNLPFLLKIYILKFIVSDCRRMSA